MKGHRGVPLPRDRTVLLHPLFQLLPEGYDAASGPALPGAPSSAHIGHSGIAHLLCLGGPPRPSHVDGCPGT